MSTPPLGFLSFIIRVEGKFVAMDGVGNWREQLVAELELDGKRWELVVDEKDGWVVGMDGRVEDTHINEQLDWQHHVGS